MAKGKLFSFDHMAVGCVVIAGVVEAAQQALIGAPNVSSALPSVFSSPELNYLPFGLITLAGVFWFVNQFRSPATSTTVMSSGIGQPKNDVFLPVVIGPSLPIGPSATSPERRPIDASPFELAAFFDEHLTPHAEKLLEPYIGQRMRVTAKVMDVSIYTQSVSVRALLEKPENEWRYMSVLFRFDLRWKDRMLLLKKDKMITAVGNIEQVESRVIILAQCELIEDV
jgi:hypothetical protein